MLLIVFRFACLLLAANFYVIGRRDLEILYIFTLSQASGGTRVLNLRAYLFKFLLSKGGELVMLQRAPPFAVFGG